MTNSPHSFYIHQTTKGHYMFLIALILAIVSLIVMQTTVNRDLAKLLAALALVFVILGVVL